MQLKFRNKKNSERAQRKPLTLKKNKLTQSQYHCRTVFFILNLNIYRYSEGSVIRHDHGPHEAMRRRVPPPGGTGP